MAGERQQNSEGHRTEPHGAFGLTTVGAWTTGCLRITRRDTGRPDMAEGPLLRSTAGRQNRDAMFPPATSGRESRPIPGLTIVFLFALAIVITLLLAGCGGSSGSSLPQNGGGGG